MENSTSSEIISDPRQSPEYANYMRSIGWQVIGTSPQAFVRRLGFLGSIAKIQRVTLPLEEKFLQKLKKEHVWMSKLEPLMPGALPLRFKQDNWPMLATKTLRVDLSLSPEKILRQFKKDCRYSLRRGQENSMPSELNNFERFYDIWKQASGIKKLWIPPKRDYLSLVACFGKNCFSITVGNLAGSLVLIHKNVAYYYYSGALPEGKKLNLPYVVIWECMKEAKKRKCSVWDFEGIYDTRFPNKNWKGFSHFKQSFGGYEVSFPGSFTKWF